MSQHSQLNARAEELGLWNRPRAEVRTQLIEMFRPIAQKTAEVFSSKYPRYEPGECQSEADLALIKAVDGFDASRGAAFATYVQSRVNMSLLDVPRSKDWVPHRARTQERARTSQSGTDKPAVQSSGGMFKVVSLAPECQIAQHNQSQEHANNCETLDEIFSRAPEHVARIAREMIEENLDMQALARRWSVSDALAYAIARETRKALAVAASAC